MSAIVALKARFVFPVSGPPIAEGCVTVGGGRIVAVGPPPRPCLVRDLGNVAIVPGLVNAHTHLEFSDLAAPLGKPGMPLPDWIRLIVAHRRGAAAAPWTSVELGLRECLASGTTALGEIATTDWRPSANIEPLPDVVAFREALVLSPAGFDSAVSTVETFLRAESQPSTIHAAVSPHAPYTVPLPLLASLLQLAERHDVPLAMHVAESREELEWLATGGGLFRDIIGEAGERERHREPRRASVLDYLGLLARARRALVIHGNYLTDEELEFIAARAATLSVVYCPRTHEFFGHEPYPLRRMLDLGVPVAVGTDSRASNPDLNLLAEMQFVAARHPQVSAAEVLELGTLAGAKALGLDKQAGTLEPSKLADLAVIRLGDADARDPHELLLDPTARVVQTYLRGVPLSPTNDRNLR